MGVYSMSSKIKHQRELEIVRKLDLKSDTCFCFCFFCFLPRLPSSCRSSGAKLTGRAAAWGAWLSKRRVQTRIMALPSTAVPRFTKFSTDVLSRFGISAASPGQLCQEHPVHPDLPQIFSAAAWQGWIWTKQPRFQSHAKLLPLKRLTTNHWETQSIDLASVHFARPKAQISLVWPMIENFQPHIVEFCWILQVYASVVKFMGSAFLGPVRCLLWIAPFQTWQHISVPQVPMFAIQETV